MNGEAPPPRSDGDQHTAASTSRLGHSALPPGTAASARDAPRYEAFSPADPRDVEEALRPATARPVRRRSFFNDMPDRGLFILFAVLGFGGTFVAKTNGLPALTAALMAVGVLVAYALVSYRFEWFRLHPDRLGDNCYYMGFLFTLASLSAALIEIEVKAPDARAVLLEGLIGSFGVALFSTIGGITLRVFFMQMRREVEDIEEAIRTELQDAAQRLKDQLGTAVQSLEGFRLRTSQVMDEQLRSRIAEFASVSKGLSEHLATSGAAHAAASERLGRHTDDAAARLAQAAVSMAANMQKAGDSHREATESLIGIAKKVSGEVGRLVQRIENIDVPSDLLIRQVEDARQRINALALTQQAAAERDAERQAALGRSASNLGQLLQRLAESSFPTLEQSVARLPSAFDAASGAIRSVGEHAAAQASTMSAATAQAELDAAAIAKARAAAQDDLTQSAAALHKLQATLADVAERLVERLGEH